MTLAQKHIQYIFMLGEKWNTHVSIIYTPQQRITILTAHAYTEHPRQQHSNTPETVLTPTI